MSKREPIRVLIVDDHREMAKGIEATLRSSRSSGGSLRAGR